MPLIRFLKKHEDKIILAAVYLAAAALIIDTLLELIYSVLDYKAYQFMFQWLSAPAIYLRYCMSILWRCAYILALAGLCLRKEFFRKSLIVLTWMEIAVFFLKHPYQSIVNANIYTQTNLSYFSVTWQVPWSSQPVYPYFVIVMLQLWVIDLVKALLILYLFSYPNVRKFFK